MSNTWPNHPDPGQPANPDQPQQPWSDQRDDQPSFPDHEFQQLGHGSGVQGSGVQGTGVLGSGIQGTDIPGSGILGSGVHGSGVQGSGVQGSGIPGSGVQGSGVQGSGIPGSDILGSGIQGSGIQGSGIQQPSYLEAEYEQGTSIQQPQYTVFQTPPAPAAYQSFSPQTMPPQTMSPHTMPPQTMSPHTMPPQTMGPHQPSARFASHQVPPGYPGNAQATHTADGVPLAEYKSRIAAALVDGLIVTVCTAIVTGPLWVPFARDILDVVKAFNSGMDPSLDALDLPVWWRWVFSGLTLAVGAGYHLTLLRLKGATFGLMTQKLRVVPVDHGRAAPGLAWRPALLRVIAWVAPTTVLPTYGFVVTIANCLFPLRDKKRQALHDLVAKTQVISTRVDEGQSRA